MDVGFDNTCTVSGVEHSVVLMAAGSQSRRSRIESYGWPIFDSRFRKFVFGISEEEGVYNFLAHNGSQRYLGVTVDLVWGGAQW